MEITINLAEPKKLCASMRALANHAVEKQIKEYEKDPNSYLSLSDLWYVVNHALHTQIVLNRIEEQLDNNPS